MDYIKIRISSDLDKLASEFDKTIEEVFQTMSPMFSLSERTWKPLMDIYETDEEIIVLVAAAGVAKEDIELEVNTRAIRISGKRIPVFTDKNTRYCLAEIQYGSFERILFLPSPIDTEIVSASYLNGFLQIRMAKLQINRTRKIQIDERK